MVRVQHHGDAVKLGHLSYVQGHRYGARDGGLLLGVFVVDALTGEEGGATVRRLKLEYNNTSNTKSHVRCYQGTAIFHRPLDHVHLLQILRLLVISDLGQKILVANLPR